MLTEVEIEALIESDAKIPCDAWTGCQRPVEWRLVFSLSCGHGSYLTCGPCKDTWLELGPEEADLQQTQTWLCTRHGWQNGKFVGLYPWG